MRIELEGALSAARSLPAEELPRLLGDLEQVRAVAWSRLAAPAAPRSEDKLVDVGQAAERLGVSRDYLHRHDFPFKRRLGRRVLFSSIGMDNYLRKRK